MRAYGGVDVLIHVFITSALVGDECAASRLGRLTLGETLPNPMDRRLGGYQNRYRHGEDKNNALTGIRINLSAPQPEASRYTNCAISLKISPNIFFHLRPGLSTVLLPSGVSIKMVSHHFFRFLHQKSFSLNQDSRQSR
jgi:hypothetical protein